MHKTLIDEIQARVALEFCYPLHGLCEHNTLSGRFDSAADARNVHAPLLAIVAEHDSIIPVERSQAPYDAWAGLKTWVVVPGTDHNTLSGPNAFWDGVGAFLGARRS